MLNELSITPPLHYLEIAERSKEIGFNMLSDLPTGSLLRTLCASRSAPRVLELGTGTGLSLCWIAEGADDLASITSIDNALNYQSIAKQVFNSDERIDFLCTDANEWLRNSQDLKFDLIFADAWPGKFEHLDEALLLVKDGGFYVIDDLLPQPNWPEGHQAKVDDLVEKLIAREDFVHTVFNWSTGLMVCTKIG